MTTWNFYATNTGYSGSMQMWTAPYTGIYEIVVSGAQGGQQSEMMYGGRGARMIGYFTLQAGTQLRMLVGQTGESASSDFDAGAGGGSFVAQVVSSGGTMMQDGSGLSVVPLIIAGGGGGDSSDQAGCDAPAGEASSGSTNNNYGHGGTGGTGGNGGGFFSSGTGSGNYSGGMAFILGGYGGSGTNQYGGYGGGAGGNDENGCGGGGWTGGIGSDVSVGSGGGGSYNAGANQTNSGGVNTGNGLITITDTDVTSANTATPTNVGIFSVRLNTSVNIVTGYPRDVYFQYGPTTSYGSTLFVGQIAQDGTYSFDLPGLTPNTTYNYRSYVVDNGTYIYGPNQVFTTKTGLGVVTTNSVSNVSATTAQANGTITSFNE